MNDPLHFPVDFSEFFRIIKNILKMISLMYEQLALCVPYQYYFNEHQHIMHKIQENILYELYD